MNSEKTLGRIAYEALNGDPPWKYVHEHERRIWNTIAQAVAAAVQPKWLPIETAPVATKILALWRPVDHAARPFHKECVVGSRCYSEPDCEPDGRLWANGMYYDEKTHIIGWQPLPQPPKEEEK